MQPLLSAVGEKASLVVSQAALALKWMGIGLVVSKEQVFAAEATGALAFIALPTVMGLKANAVHGHEQGSLQVCRSEQATLLPCSSVCLVFFLCRVLCRVC
jgi:hypothetical protein